MIPDHESVALVIEEGDFPSDDEIARWLAEQLDGWLDRDRALIGVVVGELLHNARRHALPPYVLQLGLDEAREALVVAVRDEPLTRFGGWDRGAGLLLVDALSARWGVLANPESTIVWAELVFD
ncbi:ATP-binding protein [Saccharothrix sp.]|uniref:ATP-binding protein n=1 Tax=Saccharothrix sp. TaxID=1873460 RepID=UPI0028127D70|nr:ATP-binding protein [Saccharothrix sp.]